MHNEAWGISYAKGKQDKMADGNEKKIAEHILEG